MTAPHEAPGFEAGIVRAGWELVQLTEQLGSGPAQRLLADRWDSERRRGTDGYIPLVTGDLVTPANTAMYESPTNLARFRRTLDFVLEGDRVLEVGIGRGYLGTRVLREGGASAYLGIDLLEEYAAATRQTLAANGLDDRGTAETGDLYELTRDQVEEFGADLLICCEVIEHVPDPEAALRVLADALPDGTDLLISTPLLGRLEAVWEHVAIFGVARLQRMLESAGLTVHHVEPLANQWVLLLASRPIPQSAARPSPRAAQAVTLGAPVVSPQPQPDLATRVTNVAVAKLEPLESRWNKRLTSHSVERLGVEGLGLSAPDDAESLVVRLTAQPADGLDDAAGRYGGVAFSIEQTLGVRFELEPIDLDAVSAVYADFYAGSSRVGRWKWDLADRPTKQRPTFILRPGLKGQFFKPVSVGDLRSADRVELFVQLPPGGSAEFRLHRFAVVS